MAARNARGNPGNLGIPFGRPTSPQAFRMQSPIEESMRNLRRRIEVGNALDTSTRIRCPAASWLPAPCKSIELFVRYFVQWVEHFADVVRLASHLLRQSRSTMTRKNRRYFDAPVDPYAYYSWVRHRTGVHNWKCFASTRIGMGA